MPAPMDSSTTNHKTRSSSSSSPRRSSSSRSGTGSNRNRSSRADAKRSSPLPVIKVDSNRQRTQDFKRQVASKKREVYVSTMMRVRKATKKKIKTKDAATWRPTRLVNVREASEREILIAEVVEEGEPAPTDPKNVTLWLFTLVTFGLVFPLNTLSDLCVYLKASHPIAPAYAFDLVGKSSSSC